MPTAKIPFALPSSQNVSEAGLKSKSAFLIDGFVDEDGNDVKRPGSAWRVTVGSGDYVDGIFYWPNTDRLYVAAGGGILTYDKSGSAVDLKGSTPLNIGRRCSFTTDGTYIFVANGGYIQYSDGIAAPPSTFAVLSDPDAPELVDKIGYLDSYILAFSTNGNKFYWSEVGDSLNWSALNFASAAANPDIIVSMLIRQREILLFGRKILEIWENDGQTPFSRIPGGVHEVGCAALDSPINVKDGTVFWLDNDKHFTMFKGGVVQRLYTAYDKDVANMTTVSDCRTSLLYVDGREFILFDFHTSQRTFVHHYKTDFWYEWGSWDSQAGNYKPYLYWEILAVTAWNRIYGGHRYSTRLSCISSDYKVDEDLAIQVPGQAGEGEEIRIARRTGQISHDTSKDKRNEELRITVNRGETVTSSEPFLMLRWKDNNTTWSEEERHSLGSAGDRNIVVETQRTGIYATRQWELSVTDSVPVSFVDMEEDFKILR